jgi:hypothetical protein
LRAIAAAVVVLAVTKNFRLDKLDKKLVIA